MEAVASDSTSTVPAVMGYQLTVRIPLVAMDDIEARQKAQDLLKEMKTPDTTVKKLQRIQVGKPPEGVKLD